MHYAKSLLAISLASALCAETLPISSAFIDGMKTLKIEVKPTINPNIIEVVTPIETLPLFGGGTYYKTESNEVKEMLERQCLAYGGDVYFQIKDNFGDTVEAHSFDTAKFQSLSAEQRAAFTKLDPSKKNSYLLSYKEFRNLFTDQRLKRGFIVADVDVLRPQDFHYDTTCKAIDSGKTIYTAKTKRYSDTMLIAFSDEVTAENFAKPKISKTIESQFSEFVTEHKGNKYLLPYKLVGGDYTEIVRAFCEEASGKLVVDGSVTNVYNKYIHFNQEIGCAEIEHPYTLRQTEPFKYMLLTDTDPMYVKNAKKMETYVSDIQMQELALSTATLPLGTQSENNIGNRKLVSTVYSDNGNSKLINVQEVGGNKSYKNYKVQSDWAKDITDDRFVYSNLKLPQSIQNAKNSLVQQCSQYGAGKVSIDGYTATCSRQAYGNQCSVNMIYMRNDQFAGREALGCK
ncbi:hypothetical protein [Sulfuricurvum sp.]|uniref:hypothetical protein n=1 Tax=Sulfuricurvum sp. TaxID=2025608 RepID=UPI002629C2EC|nr:hypothetical protein [Sulfuricurvum sp.]MDD3595900.1 hypothetical protein [Sulfuricurvum sp.]